MSEGDAIVGWPAGQEYLRRVDIRPVGTDEGVHVSGDGVDAAGEGQADRVRGARRARWGIGYLIIHIDAIAYQTFERALAERRVSTFERIFEDGVTRPALSLFPGSAPVIYSRLRTGEANDEGVALGIGGWWDRERDEVYPELPDVAAGTLESMWHRKSVLTPAS